MFKPMATASTAAKSLFPATRQLTLRRWTALVVVPLIVMGLLTWAFWSPETDHDTAQAAVVNLDEPVEIDGQTVPLGRTLAGDLIHDTGSAYDWVLTDAEDARAGLDNGTYAAVVTVPEDFSAKATSAATEENPLDAVRGALEIETTTAGGVADPILSRGIALDTQDALDRTIIETYLDGIYSGFTTIHEELEDAAHGANQLADGTSELSAGATELAGGAAELQDGAAELADGSARLADGTAELSTGATELAAGSTEVADGAAELADATAQLSAGLTTAAEQTAQLPAQTRRLAEGADQVADGNEQLAAEVVPLANDAIAVIDSLPEAQDAAADVRRVADRCGVSVAADPDFCEELDAAADQAEADAERLDAGKTQVRGDVVEARDSVQDLATGARQVADGNAELAKASIGLANGIAEAASGAQQTAAGAEELSAGAQEVAAGAQDLSAGAQEADDAAQQVAAGASELSSGTGELTTGAEELADGAAEVDDGANELANGLNDAVDEVPSYTDDEKDYLSRIAADPTVADIFGSPFGALSITLFAVLALWALALVTYIATRPVPQNILVSREPTWRIIVRAAAPGAIAAASAATVISAIAIPVLDLHATTAVGFLLVALLAAATFVALNQALAAILGTGGRLASLAVVVVAAATGIISTLPGPLHSIGGMLPTHGAVIALRAVATDSAGLATGVGQLVAWLAVGLLATILVTDRRRYLGPRALRLAFSGSGAE